MPVLFFRPQVFDPPKSARLAGTAPLLGVPVTIKDHIWMRGVRATNGSLAYRDFVLDVDCEAVARLRAAGAVIVGKTNNPEFCYRGTTDNLVFGLTRNPWNLKRATRWVDARPPFLGSGVNGGHLRSEPGEERPQGVEVDTHG